MFSVATPSVPATCNSQCQALVAAGAVSNLWMLALFTTVLNLIHSETCTNNNPTQAALQLCACDEASSKAVHACLDCAISASGESFSDKADQVAYLHRENLFAGHNTRKAEPSSTV